MFQGNESDAEKVDKDVTGEVEGMVKTPPIPWDSRQSEVRDELTDATNLELPWKFVRRSWWVGVVGENTTEILDEIDETWIELKRKTRTQEPSQPEEDGKNRQMIQTFVKVDGSMMFQLMVSPSNKVDDVMRRILNNVKSSKSDVYMTCERRVFRWSDELRSSRVGDAQCRS